MLRTPLRIGSIVAAFVLLASCTGSDPGPEGTKYVAIGDSSAAGVGIGDPQAPGCGRSPDNYPGQVAKMLKVDEFVDTTCPGATTTDVLKGQTLPSGVKVKAQIGEITTDTDIVTVSIGGNDEEYVPALFLSCYVPASYDEANCARALSALPKLLGTVRANVAELLRDVQAKAPDALVVVVSYLRVVPDSGSCRELGLQGRNLAGAADAEDQLDDTIQAAAKDAGVDVIDMHTPSKGHDACASKDTSWVNAMKVEPGDGTYLHPRASGAQAVADTVAPAIKAKLKSADR